MKSKNVLRFSSGTLLLFSLLFIGVGQGLLPTNLTLSRLELISDAGNYADIPADWWIDREGQYLDYGVYHDSTSPSIRMEATSTTGNNPARECNARTFGISPGDHILYTCWVKTTATGMSYQDWWGGARIGIDFYDDHRITAIQFNPEGATPTAQQLANQDSYYFWVDWGTTTWTQMTIDFIVPSQVPSDGSDYPVGELHTPSAVITSVQVWDSNGPINPGMAWFSEPILLVNPYEAPTPTPNPSASPTATPAPTTSGGGGGGSGATPTPLPTAAPTSSGQTATPTATPTKSVNSNFLANLQSFTILGFSVLTVTGVVLGGGGSLLLASSFTSKSKRRRH